MQEIPSEINPQSAGPMQAKTISLEGGSLHVWTGGSGPVLLLLHSAFGDAELSWRGVWNALAQRFTVVAPDLPGLGRSSALPRPSVQAMADCLETLLTKLNVRQAFVLGNSFGASVAIDLALRYPHRIRHLILANGVPLAQHSRFVEPLRKVLALPGILSIFAAAMHRAFYSKRTLNNAFVNFAALPTQFVKALLDQAKAKTMVTVRSVLGSSSHKSMPSAPLLLLWGASDKLRPLHVAQELKERVPGAEVVAIEGAGHMPQIERPTEFVAALLKLLEGRAT